MTKRISLIITAFIIAAWSNAFSQENFLCLTCHLDSDLTAVAADGDTVSAYVDTTIYSESIHHQIGFECINCHEDIADIPHEEDLSPVNCVNCHEDIAEIYNSSIHGQLLLMGDREVPVCVDCHGTHNIFPASDSRSTVNKFNLMYTCATCHQNTELMQQRLISQPEAVPQFLESVHAKGLLRDGLIVAPSCNDCHGVHEIQVSSNPASPIYQRNVYKTCGKCHTKVEEVYIESVHGQLVESGDRRGPVCINCHESHQIISPELIAYKQYSDKKCGQCHEDMLERYHETFHGKAMALGSTEVAACYDCHGYHNIYRTSDPRSLIHEDNRVATCNNCHDGANKNFAGYITHADHLDRKSNPQLYYTFLFMTALLIGVFLFFGLHTLLWVARSVALFLRDSKAFREMKIKVGKEDLAFVRFTPLERFLHILLIISFTTLVITGIPLKFFTSGWAQMLMKLIGGVENAGYMHRSAAFILVMVFLMHVVTLTNKFIPRFKKFKSNNGKFSFSKLIHYFFRPDSLIPNMRDIKDFWAHQKWFFGKGAKPKFDRWTYWEKFDYFAVFWGVVIIGFSGIVMWFPVFFTKFLPGWTINVALIIHSDEALLAAGFIFTFHFFNVHFRIEKFPMDTVIFSGRISKVELIEERSGWMERLQREGNLESIQVRDEWEGWKPIARTFGFIAFGTGIFLAGAIITAMFIRLLF